MHLISIDASPKQLSKLRNGHKVRIRQGTGVSLVVHPETYGIVSHAFQRDKGIEIALSQDEVQANAEHSMSGRLEGQGIFGSKADRWMEKKGIKKAVYHAGSVIKPYAKAGIHAGVAAGTAALMASATALANPELIPFIASGGAALDAMVQDYVDNPNTYHGKSGAQKMNVAKNMGQQYAQNQISDKLNQQLGTNYDYMSRAGLDNAIQSEKAAQLNKLGISARQETPIAQQSQYSSLGFGLGAGRPSVSHMLYHRSGDPTSIMGRGFKKEVASIGKGGGMLGMGMEYPPALESQPFSANFQFQHFLPTHYQQFSAGAGIRHHKGRSAGLYAGKGLYA